MVTCHFISLVSGGSRIWGGGGGAHFQGEGTNLLFGQIFPENCMKLTEFGSGGGPLASLAPLLDLPMMVLLLTCHWLSFFKLSTIRLDFHMRQSLQHIYFFSNFLSYKYNNVTTKQPHTSVQNSSISRTFTE